MPKIPPTLACLEGPDKGPDPFANARDGWLRDFAKNRLERMKHHLDRIEVWRILRQVAQTCTSCLDGFLNTKRLLVREVEGRPLRSLGELLQPALTVDASLTGDRLLAELRGRRAHQAIVRDQQGRVVGMVTLDDILSSLLGPTPDEFTQSTLRIKAPRATRSRT